MSEALIIVGILSGVFGIFYSLYSSRRMTLQTVKAFFEESDSKELSDRRKRLYDLGDKNSVIDKHDEDVRYIIAFYEKWAILLKRFYLPIWVFEGAAGAGVIKQFDILNRKIVRDSGELKSYFDDRRVFNQFYGKSFEYLTNRIKKKYPHLIHWNG